MIASLPFVRARVRALAAAAVFVLAGMALLAGSAAAQPAASFPSRPVTLILPVPPGGSVDMIARTLQQRLGERLGQPVVIDSRPGASGRIAAQAVQRAAPDGHTLLLTYDPYVIGAVSSGQGYDVLAADLKPVSLMARLPFVITTSNAVRANNLREFIAEAKASPRKFNYATNGVGTIAHLGSEDLKRLTGIDAVHVPYKGGSQAVQGLMADEVQFGFNSYAFLKPFHRDGKLKVIAAAGARRVADLPDVATVAEAGYPGFEIYTWFAVLAPMQTPDAALRRVSEELGAVLREPAILSKLEGAGFEIVGSSPEELGSFLRKEFTRWSGFVKETGLKLE